MEGIKYQIYMHFGNLIPALLLSCLLQQSYPKYNLECGAECAEDGGAPEYL